MGIVFNNNGFIKLNITDFSICLICQSFVYKGEFLCHSKLCASITLRDYGYNFYAIRVHLLFYLCGFEQNLITTVNLVDNVDVCSFLQLTDNFVSKIKQRANTKTLLEKFTEQERYFLNNMIDSLYDYFS